MYIDFEQIANNARVWVYQADRPLSTADVLAIETALQPSLNSWTAHNEPLLASTKVTEDRFIVIAVDETHHLPSGCSIDASVHFLQRLGQQLGINFFDRSVPFINADGQLQTLPLSDIKAAVADGILTPETTVFNTLVKTKSDLLVNWRVQAGATWLKRYFPIKQLS